MDNTINGAAFFLKKIIRGKGKVPRKRSLHGNIAASVDLNLFKNTLVMSEG